MTEKQIFIYKAIDEILWNDWDPIGINQLDWSRDEYQGYLYKVFELKIEKADLEIIAEFLHKAETERMGLPGNIANCRRVAEKIIALPE